MKIQSLSYTDFDNSLMKLFMMNPQHAFTNERIHDWFINHWQIDLAELKPFQRQSLAGRLSRSLKRLEHGRIITKNTRVVALRGGRRVEYQYRNPAKPNPNNE